MSFRQLSLSIVLFFQFSVLCAQNSVMTFNIRYDAAYDNEQNWQYRKQNVADLVLSQNPDIVGFQEVLHNQLEDLVKLLPEYLYVGVGRDDGLEKGESVPVFYKSSLFTLVQSGHFWLSETPDVPSFGWEAACIRMVTWVILKENSSGEEFAVYNTHFDHVGKQAANESSKLILLMIHEIAKNRKVILLGDFNANPQTETINNICMGIEDTPFIDSRLVPENISGPEWTFHDFGRLEEEKRERIDYIFLKNYPLPYSYSTFYIQNNGIHLSDHCPVFIVLKKLPKEK